MKKKTLIVGALLVIASVALWAGLHFGSLFGIYSKLHFDLNAKPEWRIEENKEFGIRLESPYELRWETKEQTTKSGRTMRSLFGLTPVVLSGPILSVSAVWIPDLDKDLDPDKLLESFLLPLQHSNYVDPKWEAQPVTCSDLPATLITGSYFSGDSQYSFSRLFVAKGKRYWYIDASQRSSGPNDGSLGRITSSVKVVPEP